MIGWIIYGVLAIITFSILYVIIKEQVNKTNSIFIKGFNPAKVPIVTIFFLSAMFPLTWLVLLLEYWFFGNEEEK